jgi:hypothetical protein
MSEEKTVRWGWLRIMYVWTIIIAGGFGLGMIFVPNLIKDMFEETCDPLPYGILGSVFLAFALLSILGLRDPLKFVPVLLFHLVYKTIWFVGVVLPVLIAGEFPTSAILTVVIFALTIVGDLIAIPFWYVFAKQSDALMQPD